MATNDFGYVGASPTQSNSSNTGVFGSEDVYDLIDQGKWARQDFSVSYLVIAGGGSGGAHRGGGGGDMKMNGG